MKSSEYREYLKSDGWRDRRSAALRRADGRCQLCNSTDALDVHHRTYDRVGAELESDLTVLCRECHKRFHDRMASTRARSMLSLEDRVNAAIRNAENQPLAAFLAARGIVMDVEDLIGPQMVADSLMRVAECVGLDQVPELAP